MWRDESWLLDILTAARRVLQYAEGHTEASFQKSQLTQDAILRQLTVIGEAAKRISPEFRTEHPDIPWRRIAGFRDVVVHEYFRVNLEEVWRIAREDVPELVRLIAPLVPPEEG